MKRIVNKMLPVGTKRRAVIKRIVTAVLTNGRKSVNGINYDQWVNTFEPTLFKDSARESQKIKDPLISIVVPCYNTPEKYLKPLLESVANQVYQNWQLCLVDASSDSVRAAAIKDAAQKDKRITYVQLEENLGIAGNTNIGIQVAKGEYVGFADHDDTLSPYALIEAAKLLDAHPDADLIYSDEDKLSDDGIVRSLPFFKPDWSPTLLESVNYMAHFVLVRRSFLENIGGIRLGFDGAQDYDFILRAMEKTEKIYHIPKILYHWRMADGSTARAIGEKNYADEAGRKALAEHVMRKKIPAAVVPIENRPTNYRLKYDVPAGAKASIIIPFKDKVEYLEKLIPSIIAKTKGVPYEVLLISNNSEEERTKNYLKRVVKEHAHIKKYEYNKPFNWSAVNNFGRSKASGDYLVFLNNDTEVITDNWLSELVGVASRPDVGAVGPLLLYPDNRIQHAGVVLGMNTMAGHAFRFRKEGELTPFGLPDWPRDYIAVTGACLVVATNKFDEIGGFDESIIIAGSDVAFCIRLYERGLRSVYWPSAKLYHYESISVGTYNNGIIGDYNRSLDYYTPYLKWKDPYFNPNLDILNESIGIRSTYE